MTGRQSQAGSQCSSHVAEKFRISMNSCFEFKNTCSVCAGTGVNEPSSTAGDGYNIISNI